MDFVLRLPAPDSTLSLVVGDCVHNLRSALDHLVYSLAEFKSMSPRSAKERRDSMFPICLSEAGNYAEFERQVSRGRLNGIPQPAIARIKLLQPTSRTDALWILSELENIDKHRRLTLPLIALSDFEIEAGDRVSTNYGKYRDGHQLIRLSLTDSPERAALIRTADVKMKGSILVALEDVPTSDSGASEVLQQIAEFIGNNVIPALEPFFN